MACMIFHVRYVPEWLPFAGTVGEDAGSRLEERGDAQTLAVRVLIPLKLPDHFCQGEI